MELAPPEAPPHSDLLHSIASAEAALARGDLRRAERELLRVDAQLRRSASESELREIPRGLVGYSAAKDREHPVPREEDSVANRLLLVQRLVALRRADERARESWVARLLEAEFAYRAGDRRLARRLIDEVHAEVERTAPATRNREPGSPGPE